MNDTCRSASRIDRHLLACSLMAGGAMVGPLVTPQVADADIYSVTTTLAIAGPSYYTIFFDIGTAGSFSATMTSAAISHTAGFAGAYSGAEFAIAVGPSSKILFFGNYTTAPADQHVYHGYAFSPSDADALLNFAKGASIAASPLGFDKQYPVAYDDAFTYFGYGGWTIGTKGYVGGKVARDVSGTPDYYYFWVSMLWGGPGIATIYGFGFESTAGTTILAGATAVPEPGTAALGLLALGAAGIASWRRRREESDTDAVAA